MIVDLNNKGINVEIQSIRKEKKQSILILKLSDFSIGDIEFIEKFFKKNDVKNLKIQFFSSPE